MTPQETAKLVCGEFYVPGKRYPGDLPAEVEQWYAYCSELSASLSGITNQTAI